MILVIGGQISKKIVYASNLTYAFFLTQFFTWKPIEAVADYFKINDGRVKALLAFGLCTGISIVLYEIVEKILKRLIARYFRFEF